MTDAQVVKFVNGCEYQEHAMCALRPRVDTDWEADYPAYELYTEVLRQGIFDGEKGKQVWLVVGRDRKVTNVQIF